MQQPDRESSESSKPAFQARQSQAAHQVGRTQDYRLSDVLPADDSAMLKTTASRLARDKYPPLTIARNLTLNLKLGAIERMKSAGIREGAWDRQHEQKTVQVRKAYMVRGFDEAIKNPREGMAIDIYTELAHHSVCMLVRNMCRTIEVGTGGTGIAFALKGWDSLLALYCQYGAKADRDLMIANCLPYGLDRAVATFVEMLLMPITSEMLKCDARCRATLEFFALLRDDVDGLRLENAIQAMGEGADEEAKDYLRNKLGLPKKIGPTPANVRKSRRFKAGDADSPDSYTEFFQAVHEAKWHQAENPELTVLDKIGHQTEGYVPHGNSSAWTNEVERLVAKQEGVEVVSGGLNEGEESCYPPRKIELDQVGVGFPRVLPANASHERVPNCPPEKLAKIIVENGGQEDDVQYALARLNGVSSTREVMAAHLGCTTKAVKRLEKRWGRFGPALRKMKDDLYQKRSACPPGWDLSYDASVTVEESYVSTAPRTVMFEHRANKDMSGQQYRIARPRPVSKSRRKS